MQVIDSERTDLKVEAVLRSVLERADNVVRWCYALGEDAEGYAAVWVWIVVLDGAASDASKLTPFARHVETAIHSDRRFWPYVCVLAESEQNLILSPSSAGAQTRAAQD